MKNHRRPSLSYRFPWREGNRFQLWVDAGQFYPAMLAAIAAARHCIALEMYLVNSGVVADRFIDALVEAAARGVEVCVLLDDYGARGLTRADRQRLLAAGVRLEFYNPLRYGHWRRYLFRDHRKLLLVDDAVAFVGGAGLTDDFDPVVSGPRHWHDVMVEVRGPCTLDWRAVFDRHWPAARAVAAPGAGAVAGDQLGRVALSESGAAQEIRHSLRKHLASAEHWAWLATAYFVPSWQIRRSLRAAARRGVDVRLLLPGPHSDHSAVRHAGRRFYPGLLRAGVRIFEYQPRFIHGKVMVCDHWVSIGSSNIDRWNLLWNLEANQEIDDQAFASYVRLALEADQAQSREISLEHWHRRPWVMRVLEWFWGKVEVWSRRLRPPG